MESVKRKPVPAPAIQPVEEPKAAEEETSGAQPEWETSHQDGENQSSRKHNQQPIKQRFDAKFDKVFPPYRRYCGLSRRLACLIFAACLLALLGLVLGLAIGLSLRNRCALQISAPTMKLPC